MLRRARAGDVAQGNVPAERTPSWRHWSLAAAGACALAALGALAFVLWPTHRVSPEDAQVQVLRQYYREVSPLFPKQFEALVLDAGAVHLQLAEAATLPTSPPLYVRVCGPSAGCVTAVTFSGQRLNLLGRDFEVLVDGQGRIFFLAKEGVWVPGHGPASGGWRFDAGWLERTL